MGKLKDISKKVVQAQRLASFRFAHDPARHDDGVCEELEEWWEAASANADMNFAKIHGDDTINYAQ